MKARSAKEVKKFLDIPNVGPAMASDFQALGLKVPGDLKNKDPLKLYEAMCLISGARQDPCVLDTYMAAVDFMNGASAKSWWRYTPLRKSKYPDI